MFAPQKRLHLSKLISGARLPHIALPSGRFREEQIKIINNFFTKN